MHECSGERLRLATFSCKRWGRESISRDGNQGGLPIKDDDEYKSKDNTLIRLITSSFPHLFYSTLVSHRFSITTYSYID